MQLVEKIDIKALQIIVDNFDLLFDKGQLGRFVDARRNYTEIVEKKTIFTALTNLLRSKRTPEPSVCYKYSKGMEGKGRKFSIGSSLQSISRVIRHTIAKNIYDDIDVVNCHPIILLKYCQDHNLKCDTISNYIIDRDQYINLLTEKYDLTRDDSKKVFLSLINGASRSQTYEEPFIMKFELEIKAILAYFIKTKEGSPFYRKAYDKKRKPSGGNMYNVEGSAINLYFCQEENKILESLCKELEKTGLRIGTYCFDGCMVYKNKNIPITNQLLKHLEDYISNETGYNMSLKVKEMGEDIDLTGLKTSQEKDDEINELDVSMFMIDEIKNSVKYDKKRDLLYIYDVDSALWETQKFDVLKNRVYNYTVRYCEKENIEITTVMLKRIKSSSWASQILRTITPIIWEKFKDSDLIASDFDKKRGLFPIANKKVIDFKTLTVRDRTAEDYFTKTTENQFLTSFNQTGVDDYIKSLLMTESKDYIDYFLSSVGYCLTGENNLKRFFILNGKRDGGKSLFIQLVNNIFQDFGGFINDKVFKQSKSDSVHNTEVFSLLEKRLGNVSELDEKDRFNEPLMKKITGGDMLNIRGCGSDKNVEVKIDSVLWLSTNDIPKFSDEAFCGRMRVFLFKNKFTFDEDKRESILALKNDLFSYLCVMCKKYYDNKKTIADIDEVMTQTNDVIQSKNSAIQFFIEKLEKTDNEKDRLGKTDLYKIYNSYCVDIGMDNIGRNKLYSTLTDTFGLKVFRDRQFTHVKLSCGDDITELL